MPAAGAAAHGLAGRARTADADRGGGLVGRSRAVHRRGRLQAGPRDAPARVRHAAGHLLEAGRGRGSSSGTADAYERGGERLRAGVVAAGVAPALRAPPGRTGPEVRPQPELGEPAPRPDPGPARGGPAEGAWRRARPARGDEVPEIRAVRVACCGSTRTEQLSFAMPGFRMTRRFFERIAALCTRLPVLAVAEMAQ